ncbi:GGDEF domain-containing protein [soil metagenome]
MVAGGSDEGGTLRRVIRRWWQQPDHYDWLAAYLTSQGVLPIARFVMLATILGLGTIPLVLTTSPAGAQTVIERAIAVTISLACAGMSLLWMGRRWPSRLHSSAFVIVSVLAISAACLVVEPQTGLTFCTLFAAIGGYIAFFHSARFMMFNLCVALATACTLAIRVAFEDYVLAPAMLVLVIVANISVPFTCQALIQLLGIEALNSDIDPLTGLLNRRAFYRQAGDLLDAAQRSGGQHLVVVMIDLDKFKRLNDTNGHAAGDRALVSIARTLRDQSRRSAVLARAGGEEFLIADVLNGSDAGALADRLRRAIVHTPPRVSASIGTVTVAVPQLAAQSTTAVIEALIAIADEAMYEAKRAGGNQSRHRTQDDLPLAS